jgi:hypothetical protein
LLLFITIGVGVALAGVTWAASSASPCGTPDSAQAQCSGTVNVFAVVPGPRPTQPVIITSPSNGQTFNTNPVQVTGTCPSATLVKVFSNGILVGSILCQNGHFTIPIDLVIGRNDLTAFAYNALDEQGPAGNTVTVTLNAPPGGPGFSTEMILQSESYYRGTDTGQEISWPIEIVGGVAPYAVSIDWGDGTTDLLTRLAPGPFTVKHTYKKPGGYLGAFPLIIRGTDSVGHTAYLQLTTIVNSPTGTTQKSSAAPLNKLLIIWPLWIVVLLMIISFWLGEKREKRIMRKQLAALA